MAVLGLWCCAGFSLAVMSRDLSLVAVHRLLTVGAFLLQITGSGVHRFQGCSTHSFRVAGLSSFSSGAVAHRLRSCGTWARVLHSMRDLPRWGIQPWCLLHWQADSLPRSQQGSQMLLVICCLPDNMHSDRYEMISHCGFDLYFLDD